MHSYLEVCIVEESNKLAWSIALVFCLLMDSSIQFDQRFRVNIYQSYDKFFITQS